MTSQFPDSNNQPYGQPAGTPQDPYATPDVPTGYSGAAPAGAYGQQPYGQAPAGQPAYAPQTYGQAPYGVPMGAPTGNLASWGTRVLSYLIDAIPAIVLAAIATPFAPHVDANTGDVVGGGFLYSLLTTILPLVWVIYNNGYKQGTTGQSIGKQVMKTRLIGEQTGQPLGFGMAIVRQLCHIVDGIILGIGYLLPLFTAKKQTIADMIVKSVVVKQG